MMDNRVFNVNGRGEEFLAETLRLAFKQCGNNTTCCGMAETEKGLVLVPYLNGKVSMPLPELYASECIPLVIAWLRGPAAAKIKLEGFDVDMEHDGSNIKGWRVFCGDWGRVADYTAICAVTPAFMWLGK